MTGKTINIKIYVTGENLEKLEQIREHLNSKNDFGQLKAVKCVLRRFIGAGI